MIEYISAHACFFFFLIDNFFYIKTREMVHPGKGPILSTKQSIGWERKKPFSEMLKGEKITRK